MKRTISMKYLKGVATVTMAIMATVSIYSCSNKDETEPEEPEEADKGILVKTNATFGEVLTDSAGQINGDDVPYRGWLPAKNQSAAPYHGTTLCEDSVDRHWSREY